MTFTPCSSACSIAPTPGKAGRSEGWTFRIRPAKRLMNSGPSSSMKPASTTRSTASPSSQSPSAWSRASRSGWSAIANTAVSTPARAGALESAGLRAARRDAHHLHRSRSGQLATLHAVQEGLEIRSLAGDQYGDAERHGQAVACAGIRRTG